ncbi:hypothetical protein GUITHDRAFT_151610, partial [Guillardia theta CCMP2712]
MSREEAIGRVPARNESCSSSSSPTASLASIPDCSESSTPLNICTCSRESSAESL